MNDDDDVTVSVVPPADWRMPAEDAEVYAAMREHFDAAAKKIGFEMAFSIALSVICNRAMKEYDVATVQKTLRNFARQAPIADKLNKQAARQRAH